MDDTQREGSDSDWDSTLDFTSPRQVGVGQPPRINLEVEEESALSDESEDDADHSLPIDKKVINNVLKAKEDVQNRPRARSPTQKDNNIILAQKQQNLQKKTTNNSESPVAANRQPANHQRQHDNNPPYNFQDAVSERITPQPAAKNPPGKERKGTTYDPAPSPTPRGISSNQGSIRSVGSWDESDQDEKTLRDLRAKYKREKQKEELKVKEVEEQKSLAEDAPHTARSETTWRSWAGSKFGGKNKNKNGQNNQQQPQPTQSTAGPQGQQVITRSQGQPLVTRSQVREPVSMTTSPTNILPQPRAEVISPPVDNYMSYSMPSPQGIQLQFPPATTHLPVMDQEDMEPYDEPKKLFVKDDDRGRYVYYFGQGNLRYYEVNEDFDEAILPAVADKVDKVAQRLWQEVFAVLRIIMSFAIWFVIELFKFLAHSIFQPIILGVFVTLGDFVIKPLLSAIFNGFVQPLCIFLWNVFTGLRHMFRPLGDILRRVLEQFAMLFRSIRLFEITWVSGASSPQQHAIQQV